MADGSEGYLSPSGPGGAGGYRGDAVAFASFNGRSLKYLPCLRKMWFYDTREGGERAGDVLDGLTSSSATIFSSSSSS